LWNLWSILRRTQGHKQKIRFKDSINLSFVRITKSAKSMSILELRRHIHSLLWAVAVILNNIIVIDRWIYWLRALIFQFPLLGNRYGVVVHTIIIVIASYFPMRFLHESILLGGYLRRIKQRTLIWKLLSFAVFI